MDVSATLVTIDVGSSFGGISLLVPLLPGKVMMADTILEEEGTVSLMVVEGASVIIEEDGGTGGVEMDDGGTGGSELDDGGTGGSEIDDGGTGGAELDDGGTLVTITDDGSGSTVVDGMTEGSTLDGNGSSDVIALITLLGMTLGSAEGTLDGSGSADVIALITLLGMTLGSAEGTLDGRGSTDVIGATTLVTSLTRLEPMLIRVGRRPPGDEEEGVGAGVVSTALLGSAVGDELAGVELGVLSTGVVELAATGGLVSTTLDELAASDALVTDVGAKRLVKTSVSTSPRPLGVVGEGLGESALVAELEAVVTTDEVGDDEELELSLVETEAVSELGEPVGCEGVEGLAGLAEGISVGEAVGFTGEAFGGSRASTSWSTRPPTRPCLLLRERRACELSKDE